jgi:magnesium chelatase family protein
MSLFKTLSAAVCGIDALPVDVEVDLYRSGKARDFMLVGMPDSAVRESRERIKSAFMNSGFGYPNQTTTVNLAPAHVRKEGAGFDLPMALAILGAMGTFKGLDKHLSVGELSLDGTIRPVRGALSIAVCARQQGVGSLILPLENAAEASVVEGIHVFRVRHLAEVGQCSRSRRPSFRRKHLRDRSPFPRRIRFLIFAMFADKQQPNARYRSPSPAGTTS